MSYRGHEKERPGPGLSLLSCLRQHCAVQKEIITSTINKSPLCGSHCPGDEAQPPHDAFPDALQSKPRKRNNHTPEIHPGSWSQSDGGEGVTGSLHCHTTSGVSLALPVWTNLHRKEREPPSCHGATGDSEATTCSCSEEAAEPPVHTKSPAVLTGEWPVPAAPGLVTVVPG